VALDRRERIIENLAVASALGFLTLIVATASLVVDSRSLAEEQALIAPAETSLAIAGRAGDAFFDRVYKIKGDAGPVYALMINLRSSSGSAWAAARFSPKGELLELRLLGSCASRLPTDAQGLLASFPDAEGVLRRAEDFTRFLSSGATEAKS